MTFVDSMKNVEGTSIENYGEAVLTVLNKLFPAGLPGMTPIATAPRGLILTLDNYREEAMVILNNLFLKYPF